MSTRPGGGSESTGAGPGAATAAAATPAAPSAEAALELQRRTEELEGIVRNVPDVFLWCGDDGIIHRLRTGRGFERTIPDDQAIGRPMWSFSPPDRQPEVRRLFEQARDERVVLSFQTELAGVGGAVRHLETRLVPLDSGGMLVLGRDVSSLRSIEADLRRRTEEVEAIMTNVPDGYAWCDRDGIIVRTRIGAGFDRARPGENVVGTPIWRVGGPEAREGIRAAFERARDDRRLVTHVTAFARPDGAHHHESRFIPLDDGQVLVLIRDVTERERATAELRRLMASLEGRVAERTAALEAANAELARATRNKSAFLGVVSHELRTPLNGIMGFAELLRDGVAGPLTATQREYLDDVKASADHLLRLIDELLDIPRIEAGALRFQPESVDLVDSVARVIAELRPGMASRQVAVATAIDPAIPALLLDPQRLRQVIFNLLGNALKFAPRGGQVRIAAVPVPGGRFRLEFADDGPGIAAD